jgi:hypothetical protein
MLDRRHRELISAGIDGELTPREQAELDELLAASDEARALHTELLAVGGLLDSLPRVAPPPELAERVLSRAAPRSGKVVPIRAAWRRVQLPLAFAAGLLVAVAVQGLLLPPGGSPGDTQWMSGTLAPASHRAGHRIEADGLSGEVRLGDRGGTPALEFRLQAPSPLEIDVRLAESGHTFGGIVMAEGGQVPDAGRIELAGGTVRVVGDGAAAFGLLLPAATTGADQGGAIRVAISSGGQVRYEATFEDWNRLGATHW